MTTALRCRAELHEGHTRLVLEGVIDESADLTPLLARASERVAIDLERVARINSVGVRTWVTFLAALGAPGRVVVLERCSPAMVRQLNMVATVRHGAGVASVMLPYYCPACGHAQTRLLAMSGRRPFQIADAVPCERCERPSEFDDLPEAYLAFAREA